MSKEDRISQQAPLVMYEGACVCRCYLTLTVTPGSYFPADDEPYPLPVSVGVTCPRCLRPGRMQWAYACDNMDMPESWDYVREQRPDTAP